MDINVAGNGSLQRNLAIAAACVAVNLVAGKVANLLSLPVYLDSVGTVIAAALLAPIFAIVVGVTTALLGAIVINPVYAFYAGTQLAIAVVAVLMLRFGGFRNIWVVVLTGIVIAIAAAIVSAPVTVALGGVTVPGTTAINAILIASGKSLWTAVLTGGLLVEMTDKVIATVLAWLVVQRLPKRFLHRAQA